MAEFNDDQHWAHCHHHYPHIDIGDVEQNAIVIASIADNKYATIGLAEDPVWNESTEYEANSIVVSDNAMYVSIKQVPAGTEVTDTEYWMQIGSINQVAINDVNVTVDNEIGIPSAEASADEQGNLSIDFHNLKGVTDYDELLNKPEFAAVATSGSYNDLSNTPNLATVATSGEYTDLSNTPVIKQVTKEIGLFLNDFWVMGPSPINIINLNGFAQIGSGEVLHITCAQNTHGENRTLWNTLRESGLFDYDDVLDYYVNFLTSPKFCFDTDQQSALENLIPITCWLDPQYEVTGQNITLHMFLYNPTNADITIDSDWMFVFDVTSYLTLHLQ